MSVQRYPSYTMNMFHPKLKYYICRQTINKASRQKSQLKQQTANPVCLMPKNIWIECLQKAVIEIEVHSHRMEMGQRDYCLEQLCEDKGSSCQSKGHCSKLILVLKQIAKITIRISGYVIWFVFEYSAVPVTYIQCWIM